MTKIKTYWDEIKNKETHYYGGDMGWEVHLNHDIQYTRNLKTGEWEEKQKLVWNWPFNGYKDVSRSEKSKTRKEVLFKRFREKILAQASVNREEYKDLMSRVGDKTEEEFKELIGDMRGFELRNYIRQKYWTYAESFASFYRG